MTIRHGALFLRGVRGAWRDMRAAAALEFALIALPFILMLMFTFEVAYDLFLQEALDSSLHLAARQIQTGNAQNLTDSGAFISKYMCPAAANLLSCLPTNLFISVQKVNFSASQDYWNVTTGLLPMTAGALDLSKFGTSSFCNSGPSELLLVQAIYVSPTLTGTLLSILGASVANVWSVHYNGSLVHATLSQVATVTENYAATPLSTGSAPAC